MLPFTIFVVLTKKYIIEPFRKKNVSTYLVINYNFMRRRHKRQEQYLSSQ